MIPAQDFVLIWFTQLSIQGLQPLYLSKKSFETEFILYQTYSFNM